MQRKTGPPAPQRKAKTKYSRQRSETIARTSYGVMIRITRIHQILFEQQQRDNGVRPWITTEQLAAELEVSIRTISEAIARMRDDYGMPVHYVEKRKGIGYIEKVTSFPTLVCSQSESMGLCVSMLGMSIHAGTPYADGARSIARKLTAGLRKELAVEFEALEQAVSFHCIGADAFIAPANFEVITPAVIHRQQLEIDYAKTTPTSSLDGGRDADAGLRRVEPLHLACIDFGWYLFAYDLKRKALRTFALRRIRSIGMTGVTFEPRRFDVQKELASSFGPFRGDHPEHIHLRFWGRAARMIPEFVWHRSQTIQPIPGHPGAIHFTMKVSINPRLIGWICEWLGEVAVLEPKSLRDQVREAARKGFEDQDRIGAEWDGLPRTSSSPS